MMTRSCSRGAAWSGRNGQSLKFIHIQFKIELNADTAHDENELFDKKELRRKLFPQSVLGQRDFPSHMKKLTLLGNVNPLHPLR